MKNSLKILKIVLIIQLYNLYPNLFNIRQIFMALVLRKTLEEVDERSLVLLTRVNVLILNLHLLGLTEDDRAKINIKNLYKFMFGIPLKNAIHKELEKDDRLKKQKLAEIDSRLEQQLIQYATSKDHAAICKFLDQFIRGQATQLNARGVKSLLDGFKQKIYSYLQQNFPETDPMISRSQSDWKEYIILCDRSESFQEIGVRGQKTVADYKSASFAILAAMMWFLWECSSDRNSKKILSYLVILFAIGSILNKVKFVIAPKDVVKKPETKAIAGATNFAALNKSLRENLDAFALELVKKEQAQKKKEEDAKAAPKLKNPAPRGQAPEFPEEVRDPSKPVKNKHKTSDEPAPPPLPAPAKPKIDVIKDEKHGNIYIPLGIGDKLFCFFRYNREQMLERIQGAGIQADKVIGKIEAGLFTCRINLPNSEKWGVTELDDQELAEFKDTESNPTHKVRIREDARVGAAVRTELTEWEQAHNMEKVMSPKGKVKLHGW